MASKLVGYVHTVQLKLKIEQATLPHSDDPTPIYVLDEVIATVGRDRKNIDDAVDCLEQRLRLHSTSTKQKALKLIKYMSQKGSGELQQSLLRLSPQIKELQTFRCAPDAFKGDIPWKRVQEYAREALEAIHAVKGGGERNGWNDWNGESHGLSSGKKMEGFGSGGRVYNTQDSLSTRKYEGFGSGGSGGSSGWTSHQPSGASVLDPDSSARELPFGTKLAMGFSELKNAALAGAVGLGDFGGRDNTDASHRSTYSPPTRPQIDVDAFGEHGYPTPSSSTASGPPMSRLSAPPSSAAAGSPMSAESKLVHQFVSKTSQGVRVAPTADECARFLSSCSNRGSLPLAMAFEKTLLQGNWKEVLRALCVLDVAGTGTGVSGTATVSTMVDYFKDHPQSLQRAAGSAQERVRSKALSVMKQLGIAAVDERESKTSTGGGLDLLSIDEAPGRTEEKTNASEHEADSLPSLLASLEFNDTCVELTPNSPVAGLISGDDTIVDSKPSDPFGDWLGAEDSGATSVAAPATTPVDPFAGMDMLSGGPPVVTRSQTPTNQTGERPDERPVPSQPSIPDDFFATTLVGPSGALPTTSVPPPKSGTDVDVLGAWRAATSGFTSAQREEKAFNFDF
jgi:hypothetical protein